MHLCCVRRAASRRLSVAHHADAMGVNPFGGPIRRACGPPSSEHEIHPRVTVWAIAPPSAATFGQACLFLHFYFGVAMPRHAINDKLEAGNGITALAMKWIRSEFDSTWERLSVTRCRELQEWLQSQDIGYLCPGAHAGHDWGDCPLPSVETAEVLLYQKRSAIGVVIRLTTFDTPLRDQPGQAGAMLSMMAGFWKVRSRAPCRTVSRSSAMTSLGGWHDRAQVRATLVCPASYREPVTPRATGCCTVAC